MTPEEIFAEFEAQPPLARRRSMQRYLGVEMDYPVTFADAWEADNETVRIALRFEPHSVRGIVGNVALADYPQLEHLRAGEPLRVRGRIRSVSTLWIELDISELLFCLEAEPSIA